MTKAKSIARPKVLMATFHDWASPLPLGSHHLSRGFVQAGWDVAHVSAAISPAQAVRGWSDFEGRARRFSRKGVEREDGHLWTYMPAAMLTPHNVPLLRGSFVHRNWQRLTFPNLVRTVLGRGFGDVDLLYIDTPTQAFWLEAVNHDISVARIGDRYGGFAGVPDELLVMERELIRKVDVTLYSARELEADVRAAGARRVVHLPNGIDFSHFADGDRTRPAEYEDFDGPIAVYVGEIAEWFDFATLDRLTVSMPDVEFVLIGPDEQAQRHLTARDNLHILGRRPFGDVPRYLHNADVGLIPFDVDGHPDLVHAVHPFKLYEYMACGLPVVATRWQELERIGSPALLVDDADGFADAIRLALSPADGRTARIAYARAADWSGRVEALTAELGIGPRESVL